MVGQLCSVLGCTNGYYRLNKWKDSVCDYHTPEKRVNCACLLPYALHLFPRNEVLRRQWIGAVNRKEFLPQKNSVVCSHHFVDGKPTHKNPVPSINLGNEDKDKSGHRKRRRRPQIPQKRRTLREEMDCLPVAGEGGLDRTQKGILPYCRKQLVRAESRSTQSKRAARHPANENGGLGEDGRVVLNPAETVEIVVEVSGLLAEYDADEDATE